MKEKVTRVEIETYPAREVKDSFVLVPGYEILMKLECDDEEPVVTVYRKQLSFTWPVSN